MNIRNLFVQARKQLLDIREKLSSLEEKLKQKQERQEKLQVQIRDLERRLSIETKEKSFIEIFSENVSLSVIISYDFCTNTAEVNGDPHGRSSDYMYEQKKTTILVDNVCLFFSEKEKKSFYDPHNFFIELSCPGSFGGRIVLDMNHKVVSVSSRDDSSNHSIKNPEVFYKNKNLKNIFAFAKRVNQGK
jgi:hypothetical protein